MNWDSWQAFWHMGGYGLFVWSAYGVTAVAMLAEVLLVRARQRRALAAAHEQALNPERME